MSDARRRIADTTPEPRAKALGRPASDVWRVEMAWWSEDERFAWLERVAIMLAEGLSEEEAEHAAFVDGRKHRIGAR